jgi:hypothetical protein
LGLSGAIPKSITWMLLLMVLIAAISIDRLLSRICLLMNVNFRNVLSVL